MLKLSANVSTGSSGEFLTDPMQVSSGISIASIRVSPCSNALSPKSPEECRQEVLYAVLWKRVKFMRNRLGREEACHCWWELGGVQNVHSPNLPKEKCISEGVNL